MLHSITLCPGHLPLAGTNLSTSGPYVFKCGSSSKGHITFRTIINLKESEKYFFNLLEGFGLIVSFENKFECF